eukprot:jgi/Mesvir1/14738/Mv05383-RA.1
MGHADGGWTAVKSSKKIKRQDNAAKKAAKEDESKPVKQGPSIQLSLPAFAALDKFDRTREAKPLSDAEGDELRRAGYGIGESDEEQEHGQGVEAAANATPAPAKKVKAPRQPKPTMAQAGATLSADKLKEFLKGLEADYAGVRDVQLLRCADYFAKHFAAVPPSQFSLGKILEKMEITKAREQPFCFVAPEIIETTTAWLSKFPPESLDAFCGQLLTSVQATPAPGAGAAGSGSGKKGSQKAAPSAQSEKGQGGVFLVLAMLLRTRPAVLLKQADYLSTSPAFTSEDALPILVWVLSQAAARDICVGVAVWVRALLPRLLGTSGITDANGANNSAGAAPAAPLTSASSIDLVLMVCESFLMPDPAKARKVLVHTHTVAGQPIVTPTIFVTFLTALFRDGRIPKQFQERAGLLFLLLKAILLQTKATGEDKAGGDKGGDKEKGATAAPSKAAKANAMALFTGCLASLGGTKLFQPQFVRQAFDCVLACLEAYPSECYKAWRRDYPRHVMASLYLAHHLNEGWTTQGVEAQVNAHPANRAALREAFTDMRNQNLVWIKAGKYPKGLNADEVGAADADISRVIATLSPRLARICNDVGFILVISLPFLLCFALLAFTIYNSKEQLEMRSGAWINQRQPAQARNLRVLGCEPRMLCDMGDHDKEDSCGLVWRTRDFDMPVDNQEAGIQKTIKEAGHRYTALTKPLLTERPHGKARRPASPGFPLSIGAPARRKHCIVAASGSASQSQGGPEKLAWVSDRTLGQLYQGLSMVKVGWQVATAALLFRLDLASLLVAMPASPSAWIPMYFQAVAALLVPVMVSCYSLSKAAAKDLLRSETYKELNLANAVAIAGSVILHALVSLDVRHLAIGPLLGYLVAMAIPLVFVLGYKDYQGEVMGDRMLTTAYSAVAGLAALVAGFSLINPEVISVYATWGKLPGILWKGTPFQWAALKIALLIAPVLASLRVLASAAGRGRLGASTFKELNWGLLIYSIMSVVGYMRAGTASTLTPACIWLCALSLAATAIASGLSLWKHS